MHPYIGSQGGSYPGVPFDIALSSFIPFHAGDSGNTRSSPQHRPKVRSWILNFP